MAGKAQNPMRQGWLSEPDKDGVNGWFAHRLALMISPAWRHRPSAVCHVLDRIEIEHCRHGGQENGNLLVTYDQFVAFGVSRKFINPAIDIAQRLGLLVVAQSEEWIGDIRAPNRYRLTYVPEKQKRAPTDEWRSVTEDQAKQITAGGVTGQKTRSQFLLRRPTSSLSARKASATSSLSAQMPVPERELTSTSGASPAAPAGKARAVVVASPSMARVNEDGQAGGFIPVSEALARSLTRMKGAA